MEDNNGKRLLDLPYEDINGDRIIKMPHIFDLEYNIEIKSQLIKFLKETNGDIILDMGKTKLIDSSGISVIIMLFNLLKDDERKLTIINTAGMVKQSLEMAKISNVIDIS